ncbi:disulfide bond formation protein B [Piscirickettsia salmonis]|uniref:disulfide bond formation protein B n=1 Tax=Piscirickettsia salmonis TaxID=1238 RepID=UPI0012B6E8D0|nr:disulfide bond formation protein B [Piscirickettsia salmonis]QGP51120.1 disulfide bond formation protein B [Piscirickettsia salmonis]
MVKNYTEIKVHILFNALLLCALSILLIMAFYFQLTRNELPCPLCLLQRLCFIGLGSVALLNIIYGPRPSHYGLMLLTTLLGFSISVRQILLHIQPRDLGYGHPVFGIHFYTWGAILFFLVAIFIGIGLLLEHIETNDINKNTARQLTIAGKIISIVFLILIILNLVSVLFECGLSQCPDNPLHYL